MMLDDWQINRTYPKLSIGITAGDGQLQPEPQYEQLAGLGHVVPLERSAHVGRDLVVGVLHLPHQLTVPQEVHAGGGECGQVAQHRHAHCAQIT